MKIDSFKSKIRRILLKFLGVYKLGNPYPILIWRENWKLFLGVKKEKIISAKTGKYLLHKKLIIPKNNCFRKHENIERFGNWKASVFKVKSDGFC